MAKIQEPPGEVRGGGRPGPLMSPVAAFIVVLVGFLLVLGGIGLYVRSRQPAFEASPATTAAATSQPAQQPTAQPQPPVQAQQAPTQAVAPAAVALTAVPTPAPATQAEPALQATAIPTLQPAAAAPVAEPAGEPTSVPAAASGAAEGVRPAPTAQPTASPPTAQPAQSDAGATDERIPLAVTGDVDPALVNDLEHAYWLYWQRDAEADETLDADVMRAVADEDTVNGAAKLYDQWRAEGHAVHSDLRHHATLLSATPDRAVIFDIQEDHSYFVSLATGEPEQPYPDVSTTNVLYQFSKVDGTWKETGEQLP